MKYAARAAVLLASAQGLLASAAQCNGTFEDVSAADYFAAANPSWNLGNTLDAIPDEGSWNNPPVEASTFDDVVAAGFRSVRIPVTYTHHFVSEAPDYEVDAAWLQRVSDVIDQALARGLQVVTNVHHDSWEWADVRTGDVEVIQAKYRALWTQIAAKLACKPATVAFEDINEPPADTAEDGAHVTELSRIFLEVLAESGGWNARRVVTLSNGNNDPLKTSQWFEPPPANTSNPWALQVHYYSPYDFTFSAWGRTIWGSAEDRRAVESDFGLVRGNFTDVPIYVGEFDASPINTESAARWKWFDHVVKVANDIDATLAVWDNGLDHLDRAASAWRDPTTLTILQGSGEDDVAHSLPDATVDGAATEQWSSAYIYHRVGEEVVDQDLPYTFAAGHTVASIVTSDGTELAEGADYVVGDASITITADFLLSVLDASSPAGVYENLTVSFSAGAAPTITIVQWDVPELGATSGTATAGQDHVIPVEWAGLPRVAAVKMVAEDGTYLFDDWTQYLGPLQQARGTWDGQWRYEGDNLIIPTNSVARVIELAQPATFTFEFFPRVEGNSAEYVLSP